MAWIIEENKLDAQQRNFLDNVDINRKNVCMGRITKRFFNDGGQNGESCLFIGGYGRMYGREK